MPVCSQPFALAVHGSIVALRHCPKRGCLYDYHADADSCASGYAWSSDEPEHALCDGCAPARRFPRWCLDWSDCWTLHGPHQCWNRRLLYALSAISTPDHTFAIMLVSAHSWPEPFIACGMYLEQIQNANQDNRQLCAWQTPALVTPCRGLDLVGEQHHWS